MDRLTLGWLTLLDTPPPDVVTAAAAGGFDAVGLRITGRRPADPHYPVVGNPPAIRDIHGRLADGGLRLSNTAIHHLYPDIALAQVIPALAASAELGAETVDVTCMDPDEVQWTAFAAACCAEAARFGLTLALEFVPYSAARTLDQGGRIVRNPAPPDFGLLVDALHLARSGGTPADLARVDPALIVFAQLCDAARRTPPGMDLATEARRGRLYPGDGALPLHDFLDALPAGTEIEVETPRTDLADLTPGDAAARACAAARRFLAGYRRNRA